MNKFTILGTNQGQRGDLIMGTVVARAIKEKFPHSHFILGINEKYKDMLDLFKFHPYIDETITWEAYNNWPSQSDINLINYIKPNLFLFPMPQHSHPLWYNLVNHQTEESCMMNGFVPPKDLSCYLNRWFDINDKYKDYIAISPFTAWDKKNISNEKWQSIIDYITKERGFQVLQLGGYNEHYFNGTFCPNLPIYSWPPWDYFQSVKAMLGCSFLLCLDGGLSWCASAYNFPVLGLYGHHYDNLITPKVYEPINPNATYLEAIRAEDIPNELIFNEIDNMIDKHYK